MKGFQKKKTCGVCTRYALKLSLMSEVTLPRTVNASPPVAQTRVIFVSSLYYILGTGLFSLSLVLLHICKSPVFEKKAGAALALPS